MFSELEEVKYFKEMKSLKESLGKSRGICRT